MFLEMFKGSPALAQVVCKGLVKGFDQWFVQRSVQEVSMGTFAELSKDVSKGILKVKFEIDHI